MGLQYTTQHDTTIHYTTIHYTTLHYTTLHYTTLHYITLHYTTLHYTTHTSFSKGPATSTYTNTKKQLGESDTDTTEQFPKMFNVELLLTSNQAQCKPEMDGSQKSEKLQ